MSRRLLQRIEPADLWPLLGFALSVALVQGLEQLPFFAAWIPATGTWTLLALYGAVLLVSAVCLPIEIGSAPRAYALVYRSVLLVLLFYACTAGIPLFDEMPGRIAERLRPLQLARWVAVGCALVAWRRPGFALPLLVYVPWLRAEIDALHAIQQGDVWDYLPVLHLGALLVAGLCLVEAARWGVRRDPRLARLARGDGGADPLVTILRCSVALYFANYFRAGVRKLALDGGPLSWLLENPTHSLALAARELGTLPPPMSDEVLLALYPLFEQLTPILNFLTLGVELGIIVAILHARWTALFAALYVLFHLGIFFSSGMFFWKWIVPDLAIAVGFWSLRPARPPGVVMAALVLIFLVGGSLFRLSPLGWYDSHSLSKAYFVALTRDGRQVRVPSNYFLGVSLTMVQNKFGSGVFGAGLTRRSYGGTTSYRVMKAASRCELPVQRLRADARIWRRLVDFVRLQHAYVLAQADDDGRFAYDLYPHHVWSNPWSFSEFAELDKRTIQTYRLVLELVCTGVREGAFDTHVLYRDSRDIHVREGRQPPR